MRRNFAAALLGMFDAGRWFPAGWEALFMEQGGTLGLLAPDPRQRAFGSLDSHSGRIRLGRRARRATGAPRLRGSRLATGEARRGACGAPPIRHGSCRDTFPSGEGGLRPFSWLVALGRGSPTVAPLRPCLRAPPWLREAASSCGGRRRLLGLLRPWSGDGDMHLICLVGQGDAGASRWAVPTPGSRSGWFPPGVLRARGADLRLAREPDSRRASRACGGHGAQRVSRHAEPARLSLSVTALP